MLRCVLSCGCAAFVSVSLEQWFGEGVTHGKDRAGLSPSLPPAAPSTSPPTSPQALGTMAAPLWCTSQASGQTWPVPHQAGHKPHGVRPSSQTSVGHPLRLPRAGGQVAQA